MMSLDALEAFFEQVTPASLSGDLVASIILVVGLSLYIIKNGVKDIYILAIAMYITQTIVQQLPLRIDSLGIFSGKALIFIAGTLLVNWILHISAITKSLSLSKKPIWQNLVFGIAVAGLLLVNILTSIETKDIAIAASLEKSLFSRPAFQIFWTVFPLALFPFMKAGAKSKSSSKK